MLLATSYVYCSSWPLSRYFESILLPLFLMASAISASRYSVIGRRNFSVLAARLNLDMQVDINCHFDQTHAVRQVNDNNTWLYNENQNLYVELSGVFCCDYG